MTSLKMLDSVRNIFLIFIQQSLNWSKVTVKTLTLLQKKLLSLKNSKKIK